MGKDKLQKMFADYGRIVLSAEFAESNSSDGYQRIFPAGKFHTGKYGKITITPEQIAGMAKHFEENVLGNTKPFIDTNHDFAEANGWIEDLQAREDGLYAKIDWTPLGKARLENKSYKYVSAAIGEHINLETGKKYYPVLIAASLTNTPVMTNLREMQLSAHSDGKNHNRTEEFMTVEELIAAIQEMGELSDEDRARILEALGMTEPGAEGSGEGEEMSELKKKLELMSVKSKSDTVTIKELMAKVTDLENANKETGKEKLLSTLISEGKILPKDSEKYSGLVDKFGIEAVKELMADAPKLVDYNITGDEGDETGAEFTADDKAAAKMAGLSVEEYTELKKSNPDALK